jgi:hypothetical protein
VTHEKLKSGEIVRRARLNASVFGAVLLVGAGFWSAAVTQPTLAAGAPRWSSDWLLAWAVEPCLLAGVAGIIVARNFVALAGGRLHSGTKAAELIILLLAIVPNVVALPGDPRLIDVISNLAPSAVALLAVSTLWLIDSALDKLDSASTT